MNRPYITSSINGIGGGIKETPSDFRVDEIPSYYPSGEGEHLFVRIEKTGISTFEAIKRIARCFSVKERDIGYAGLKDSVGVTSQWLSLPHIDPLQALSAEITGIRIIEAKRHINKLKPGHLKGNRFLVVVRDVLPESIDNAFKIITTLIEKGVPNYFGEQRYGVLGNSAKIGRLIASSDYKRALFEIAGDPLQIKDERWREAAQAFRVEDYQKAAQLFPGFCSAEKGVALSLSKSPQNFEKALKSLNPRLINLYFSAAQSEIFDRLLARRIEAGAYDRFLDGDIAMIHSKGACFRTGSDDSEADRLKALEISPTGPIIGGKMMLPEKVVLELENEIAAEFGLEPDTRLKFGKIEVNGERRALRIPLSDATVEMNGDSMLFSFVLPKGGYATVVMREIMKCDLHS